MSVRRPLGRTLAANAGPFVLSVLLTVLGAVGGVALVLAGGVDGTAGTAPADPTLTTTNLLLTNGSVVSLLAAGGLVLGVPTLFALVWNGTVVGLLAGSALANGELPVFLVLFVPHGLVEFAAFWLAATAGLKLPRELLAYLRGRRETVFARRDLREVVVLVAAALALVVVAAVIEATVTATLARRLAGG